MLMKLPRTIVPLMIASAAVTLLVAGEKFPILKIKEQRPAPKLDVQDRPVSREGNFPTSFSKVIKRVTPSVVNIYSTKMVRDNPRGFSGSPLLDPFFRRFFDEGGEEDSQPARRSRPRREQSLGSGVVISEDGYLLTASHVVSEADEVKVAFSNEGRTYPAKIVGTDPATDTAVLKIEGDKFPAIAIADSEKLEVGDVVLAIGNPFGVGQTVTMGIVSAVGRGGFGIVDYEDFIQTDASINPGNSGGALVDAEGRLVGINTAIMSRSGGNQGVGFAVPINMARLVMDRLIKDGKFIRGYLGVNIQTITPDLADEFKLSTQAGALVSDVRADSPAVEAGLQEGDVITEFNGRKVSDARNLRIMVAQTPPKTKVDLKVLRDGREKVYHITLGELNPREMTRAGSRPGREKVEKSDILDGVEVSDLDPRTRRQYDIPAQIKGALVTNVEPESPAAEAGLRPGDVILQMNRKSVASADEAVELSESIKTNRVLLRVWSRGGAHYITVESTPSGRRN